MPSFSLMLLRYKFNQIKVKTKFFNSYPAPVYQGLEVIECLRRDRRNLIQPTCLKNYGSISLNVLDCGIENLQKN